MPAYYAYSQTILGSQSSVGGAAVDYNFAPPTGSAWSWTGSTFTHMVTEVDPGATFYNGDPTNEQVQANMGIGGTGEQGTNIAGTQTAVVYDYTFSVSGGGITYQIAVIDADLNGDGSLGAGEDGYYLVFLGTPPPADTVFTIGGITDNSANVTHASLGATVVCFVGGTYIQTDTGEQEIETLSLGDLIQTKDNGLQPLRWIGRQRINGLGKYAPIRFAKGAVGNHRALLVSPQHRILIQGWQAELHFGTPEVFVAAKHLINTRAIRPFPMKEVEYYHLLFDRHQVVYAEGCGTEALHPAAPVLDGMCAATRAELFALFPQLQEDPSSFGDTARLPLKAREAASLQHIF